MIRVIVCEVGARPVVREIGESLEAWQKVVGGSVEQYPLFGAVYFYCNEEGLLEGLPFNRLVMGHALVGTFFVARRAGTDMVSLNDDDIARMLSLLGE